MIAFADTFKLYLRSGHKHKLSIRVTDCVCDTYLLDDVCLAALCGLWSQNREGSVISADGNDWFVQHKHVNTADEYVRISIWQHGSCRDYRVSSSSMCKLSAQWQQHLPLSTASEEAT